MEKEIYKIKALMYLIQHVKLHFKTNVTGNKERIAKTWYTI